MDMAKTMVRAVMFLNILIFGGGASASETVIKQQRLSYQLCLEVISTTSEKLSIAPSITADTPDNYVVEYNLADGRLVIICDKKKEEIRILTE
jgi:hypothetical protein